MVIQIRHAAENDFPVVFRLLGQLWPDRELHIDEMHAVFSRGLNEKTDKYLCAVLNNLVVGFCAIVFMNNFWQEARVAHIDVMIVDETVRCQGIGARLLEEACAVAQKSGCKVVNLDSGFHRPDAHRFYEKNGYVKRAFTFFKEITEQ